MEYLQYRTLFENHDALSLIRANHGPLVLAFLNKVFKEENHSAINGEQLEVALSDFLFQLNAQGMGVSMEQNVSVYLEAWASKGWLRRYYSERSFENTDSNIPLFELTPASEKALEWIAGLELKGFVGTESRMQQLLTMLRELVRDSNEDPEERIGQLEAEKLEIEKEIERIRQRGVKRLSEVQILERFHNIDDAAKRLLGDFRQVEENFRQLDREVRERMVTNKASRGDLVKEVLNSHDEIADSAQGQSFTAFFDFLFSQSRQEELEHLLSSVAKLPEVDEDLNAGRLKNFKNHLLNAGDRVNRTTRSLIEQLRNFLDSQAYLENKKMMDLIKSIESSALDLKDNPPAVRGFWELDQEPKLRFPLSRKLWSPPIRPRISALPLEIGQAEVDTSGLYNQQYVDIEKLRANIFGMLKDKSQVSLRQIVDEHPLEKGMAELVSYLALASKDDMAFFVDDEQELFELGDERTVRIFKVPKVIFSN